MGMGLCYICLLIPLHQQPVSHAHTNQHITLKCQTADSKPSLTVWRQGSRGQRWMVKDVPHHMETCNSWARYADRNILVAGRILRNTRDDKRRGSVIFCRIIHIHRTMHTVQQTLIFMPQFPQGVDISCSTKIQTLISPINQRQPPTLKTLSLCHIILTLSQDDIFTASNCRDLKLWVRM